MEKSFLEYLAEEDITNNEIYLSNMAKSFGDKVWFLKYIPRQIETIVDFGGGEGEFCEFFDARAKLSGREFKYIVIVLLCFLWWARQCIRIDCRYLCLCCRI